MTADKDIPGDGAAAPVRLAVFEQAGVEKVHLATVTLSKSENNTWNLKANGPSESSVAKIGSVIERFTAARRALPESPEKAPPDALSEMLTASGFIVEILPAGDYTVNIQIDMKSGLVLGTNDAMHGLVPNDTPLGRQIVESLAREINKCSTDLANEIGLHVAADNHTEAVAAIKRFIEKSSLGFRPNDSFLQSLMAIDVTRLPKDDGRLVRDARMEVAQRLQWFDTMGLEADALLSEYDATLTPEERATLNMAVAMGALHRGNTETALAIWRSLLKEPSDLKAEGKGWAWRNISLSLSPDDPETLLAAQRSADAFLEAGIKEEAGKSIFRRANLLLGHEPNEAVKALDEMIDVLNREGLKDRLVRGAAFHARANRLAKLHRHADAFRDASEAVELQRGLLGAEPQFISALHLAAIEAKHVGEDSKADALAAEADKLADELRIPHFQLAQRVSALVAAYDPTMAADILRDAETQNNLEVLAGVRIIQATHDPSLTGAQRLEILEETERRVIAGHGRTSMLSPVRFAIGRQLALMGDPRRATEWFRKVLTHDPLDISARDALLDSLWKTERWGEAATFLREMLDRVGDMPGLLFAYGKSLFEAGDMSGAVSALTRSLNLASGDANHQKNATELREKALQAGGTVLPPLPKRLASTPVTREEFESAIDDFALFIKAKKRMEFWSKSDGEERKWVSKPERLAQNLFHTFLKARFDERIDVSEEELGTGAGRLDLYVRFVGGLSIIVELKMCGSPGYSSTYAASGEEQIIHYMDNRATHLGYLVVFDARTTTFGQALLTQPVGQNTVMEKFVDVRHQVSRP